MVKAADGWDRDRGDEYSHAMHAPDLTVPELYLKRTAESDGKQQLFAGGEKEAQR